jgi:ferredoxin
MLQSPGINWLAHKCISCQACLLVCPTEALHLHEGKVVFDGSKCDSSLFCLQICFTDALEKIEHGIGDEG